MCSALSAHDIFGHKPTAKWPVLFGKEKEKREYLKGIEMADDGGMDRMLRCRTSCREFWTPWWVCHEEHTGSCQGIMGMDIGWNAQLHVHQMRLHEAVSVCLDHIWSVKVVALCGRLFVWSWCYWVWCLLDGLCMWVPCCSCAGRSGCPNHMWLSSQTIDPRGPLYLATDLTTMYTTYMYFVYIVYNGFSFLHREATNDNNMICTDPMDSQMPTNLCDCT